MMEGSREARTPPRTWAQSQPSQISRQPNFLSVTPKIQTSPIALPTPSNPAIATLFAYHTTVTMEIYEFDPETQRIVLLAEFEELEEALAQKANGKGKNREPDSVTAMEFYREEL